MLSRNEIYNKALSLDFITMEEAMQLMQAPLAELMEVGNSLRKIHHPGNEVSWLIDRNMNITNVCVSGCQFCNYFRAEKHPESYITGIEEYKRKIDELFHLGGEQILLQGGMHPGLGLKSYCELFSELKDLFPELKLHALGPPEIVFLSKMESLSYVEVLNRLIASGLSSLPGAGAEILSDRVRSRISKNKCSAGEWLDVMKVAHKMGLYTSATMMFGHIETIEERIGHLISIRDVQALKPEGMPGFVSFIPWPFQDEGTVLSRIHGIKNSVTSRDYVRMIALSRIMLPNVPNIQASWLTVGKDTGQLCLHAGANDFGSIMIEENVVSVAGATYKFDAGGIQKAIVEAGFRPYLRNQRFERREFPEGVEKLN